METRNFRLRVSKFSLFVPFFVFFCSTIASRNMLLTYAFFNRSWRNTWYFFSWIRTLLFFCLTDSLRIVCKPTSLFLPSNIESLINLSVANNNVSEGINNNLNSYLLFILLSLSQFFQYIDFNYLYFNGNFHSDYSY